jgi:hypothetical protein
MPETQVPASEQGLAYLPSFAIAVMINTSIMTALPYLTTPLEWPDFATYSAAGLGILSGILWNIGMSGCTLLLALEFTDIVVWHSSNSAEI